MKILIIEDEEDIRVLLQELLEIEGFSVTSAGDGQDGLDRLRASADADLPDVIMLDLMMPVKDGFAFRAEQQADPRLRGIPVIVMSADAHIEEKRLALGVTTALRKPLEIARLLLLLHQAAEKPVSP